MFSLEVLIYLPNFFIFNLNIIFNTESFKFLYKIQNFPLVLVLSLNFPIFSFSGIIPRGIFSFSGIIPRGIFSFSETGNGESTYNPRFKMILWSIVAGTRGGINRAKILNLVKDNPLNANKIATMLNLDHKTVIHHVKILSKNELIIKAEKNYGAEYQFTQIMKENQIVLEEIMEKIGTR